jgi:hypothetical protein
MPNKDQTITKLTKRCLKNANGNMTEASSLMCEIVMDNDDYRPITRDLIDRAGGIA